MHIPNHLIQRKLCGSRTMGSHLCQKGSIASDKTQSSVLKYRSIARYINSIVSVMPPTKRLSGESRDNWNEWVASNRILVFARWPFPREDPDPCVCTINVCPVAIPEIFAQTQGPGSFRGKGHLASSQGKRMGLTNPKNIIRRNKEQGQTFSLHQYFLPEISLVQPVS